MIFRVRIYGVVQGVGFRPFISVIASNLGIRGTVANKGSYVEVIAQTDEKGIELLQNEIKVHAPERSIIFNMTIEELECSNNIEYVCFSIIESENDSSDCIISPDISICKKCKSELFDKRDRRYLHPFINCTQCGPRLTILKKFLMIVLTPVWILFQCVRVAIMNTMILILDAMMHNQIVAIIAVLNYIL